MQIWKKISFIQIKEFCEGSIFKMRILGRVRFSDKIFYLRFVFSKKKISEGYVNGPEFCLNKPLIILNKM